jgi:hypothetical protein
MGKAARIRRNKMNREMESMVSISDVIKRLTVGMSYTVSTSTDGSKVLSYRSPDYVDIDEFSRD